jgi:flagellar M-ring protein FliF
MAEPARAGLDIRRFLLLGSVIAIVAFSLLFFLFRGCVQTGVPGVKKPGYTLIYSNLDLRDAANAIARLKEINVPYEIREDGRAIAVPKEKADQARLGLAEKNLPAGGVVGWEIFDEAKLGATDFDRRIQLIRAISGELSRTIRRISGVEDARVQVVIPETKLFAATVAPVTASVMLRLRPGFMLATEKINGIVYLVASSVENLQPENVIVVDDSGRILTAKIVPPVRLAPVPPPPAETMAVLATPEEEAVTPEVVLKKEKIATKEVVAAKETKGSPEVAAKPAVTKVASLTAEERVLLKVQTKKELEQELSGKAQELLNRFYPINSVIVKVVAEIKPAKDAEIVSQDLKIKKINAVVLVDNRVEFNANLKQATYTTVAAAIGYNKKRGDTIILQRVPFHLATPPLAMLKKEAPAPPRAIKAVPSYYWLGGGVVLGLVVFWLLNILFRGRGETGAAIKEMPAPSFARERVSALDQVKMAAEQDPERIAELLKKWLSE